MLIKFSKQQTTYFAGGNNLTIIYMLQSQAGPKQILSSHSKCFFKVSKAHKTLGEHCQMPTKVSRGKYIYDHYNQSIILTDIAASGKASSIM